MSESLRPKGMCSRGAVLMGGGRAHGGAVLTGGGRAHGGLCSQGGGRAHGGPCSRGGGAVLTGGRAGAQGAWRWLNEEPSVGGVRLAVSSRRPWAKARFWTVW